MINIMEETETIIIETSNS